MRNRIIVLVATELVAMAYSIATDAVDYSKGIFFVNEDWYGHQNSSVNFLVPDDPDGDFWHYRVIRQENPGMELGCTNQFGALWNGKLYFISKQEKDPGANISGGRITVADASTMKIIHQQERIDPSGAQCDGRAFVGVDEHKAYISTSNGVWIFNTDKNLIIGQIAGTSNPNAGSDDKPNTDPTGALYHGQCGTMILASGKVFVAHQQYGLLVIDSVADNVTDIISMDVVQEGAGIGAMVRSKDGDIWLSVAKNRQGTGAFLNYIVRVEPESLNYEIIEISADMYPPGNSWYAWTPDAFVASSVQNCLYWKGGPNRWFTGSIIYKYDIDTRTQSVFVNLEDDPDDWKLYGCSLGVDPISDEVYMSLYHNFGTPVYIVRRYDADGKKIRDYEMIQNYWFPSHLLFPQQPEASSIDSITADTISLSYSGDMLHIMGAEGLDCSVYNMQGRRLCYFIVESEKSSVTLSLSSGIYLVKVGNVTQKIAI
ncbi:MAG: DUF5074 domain-containing protein [Muribaculaceae bacterium]|nr:DUF5074 domain-containing protein [Muribaculaceae bacterium]